MHLLDFFFAHCHSHLVPATWVTLFAILHMVLGGFTGKWRKSHPVDAHALARYVIEICLLSPNFGALFRWNWPLCWVTWRLTECWLILCWEENCCCWENSWLMNCCDDCCWTEDEVDDCCITIDFCCDCCCCSWNCWLGLGRCILRGFSSSFPVRANPGWSC